MTTRKKAKFITPPNRLKLLAGSGGLPKGVIDRAQKFMDEFEVDFMPEAEKLITTMMSASDKVLIAVNENKPYDKEEIITPVMQLKANGGQFKYELISDVADICLQFLEAIKEFTPDALDVVRAHHRTIEIIIQNNLRGDGGAEGAILVEELHKACNRYFKKHKK